ncbi:hypothetical protein EDC04DRAFT_2566064, partial [Pisolithus marmoratus]
IAYAYVTRRLSVCPLSSDWLDKREARRIARGVPFTVDCQSKLLHVSLTQVVMEVWARLNPVRQLYLSHKITQGYIEPRAVVVLLGDVLDLRRW